MEGRRGGQEGLCRSQFIGVSWAGAPSGGLSKDSVAVRLPSSRLPGLVVDGDGLILV